MDTASFTGRRLGSAGRALGALLLLVAGWLLVGVAAAAPALAHAELLSVDPADGTRLEVAPTRVTLTFTENVSLAAGYLRVVDGKGQRVEQGNIEHAAGRGETATIGLRPGLGDGGYIISFRVVSADSHPIAGAAAFTVGDGPLVSASGAVADASGTDPTLNAIFTTARWTSFAGLVLLGGMVFMVVCWPGGRTDRRARRIVWTGWGLAAGAAGLGLLLQGPYASGEPITAAFSPDLLSATLGTTYGRMLSVRLVALGALAALLVRLLRAQEQQADQVNARNEDLAAIIGLVVLATYGASGHAVAGIQPTVAVLSDVAHLAAVATWVGGLVLLAACLLPSRRAEELAAALPRFSRIAFGSVVVLAITGSYQAWREVGTLPALTGTEYGKLLTIKIIGFFLLIGLGNLGRVAIRRRYVLPVAHAFAAGGPPADPPDEPGRPNRRRNARRGDGPDRPAGRPSAHKSGAGKSGPGGGRPGDGRPGDGRPGDGRPGTGRPGAGRPGGGRGGGAAAVPGGAAAGGDDAALEVRGDGALVRRLRVSTALEVGIAAVVLALTAVLVSQAPARGTYVEPYEATLQLAGGATAELTVTPAQTGTNTVLVEVFDGAGNVTDPQEVALTVALEAERIGPLPVTLTKEAPGRYRSASLSLPRPGTWRVVVRIRTSEFDRSVAGTDVPIR